MKAAVLVPGTLCDGRVFGSLPDHLGAPEILDYSVFRSAHDAAVALLPSVPQGSLGIAFSLGGWVLLEMLRRDPGRFAGVLLLSGNAYPDAPENAAMRRARVTRARAEGFQALFAEDWEGALVPAHRADRHIQDAIVAMAVSAGHDAHARHAEINITRPDLRDFVADTPLPIHVLAGMQDSLCPRDRYEQAASGPQSRLTWVNEAGHYLPLEEPTVVLSYVQAYFPEHLQ